MVAGWSELKRDVVSCTECHRLVAHRQSVAADPPKRFHGKTYWAKPVLGFGDVKARVMIIGLAPAAHGANRTGRMFTGDRSGEWLYRALHESGFANQASSTHKADGLKLEDAYVSAVVRCAPPDNKPSLEEKAACIHYLCDEFALMPQIEVVVALGQIAWKGFIQARRAANLQIPKPLPKFGHGATVLLEGGPVLIGSYHPSQQNTFTGRLTQPMLASVFEKAREALT